MVQTVGLPDASRIKLGVVGCIFRAVPPFILGRTRTQALRLIGIQIGRGTAFWGLPTLVGSGQIERRLTIGDHCGFNVGCFFDLERTIAIGSQVDVGHHVMFLSQTSKRYSPQSWQDRGITVGDGVWLGARCTVLPGVKIGAGSVVAAGAVVTENLPENTLFTGSRHISLARWR